MNTRSQYNSELQTVTAEFAVDLDIGLRWRKPAVLCLRPATDVFQLKKKNWSAVAFWACKTTQLFYATCNVVTVVHNLTFYFTMAKKHFWTRASSLSRIYDHIQTHHNRYESSGRGVGPSQRLLPDNTQHSQETDIHDSGGIRTHNPSKQAAADPRLRPRGHRDRP